ncbi:MAG: RnfABCDGE type electron transport complex subunit D [Methanolobus sp.]|nr:RnfABCDGE type electron transport complex subunit D [Methanolobus sp.]
MTYVISAPPHKKERIDIQKLNMGKIIALIPLCLVAIYFFGVPAIQLIITTVLAAVITELGIQKIFKQKVTIGDGHAALIGLMLALLIPPEAPLWIPVFGGFFAIAFGKHVFGGIGSYIFSPVLVSWIFMRSAWATHMTALSLPNTGQLSDLILESGAGMLVDVSPIALIAGLYLIHKRYIEWRIPVSFFATIVLIPQTLLFLSGVYGLIQHGVLNPLMYLSQLFAFLSISPELPYAMVGVLFFGIIFLATDTPTTPVTKNGRLIYGMLCGLLVFIYGYFGNYVEGTLYGIFLASCVSSFIEMNTRPTSYGNASFIERIYGRIKAKVPESLKFEVIK